MAERRHSFRAGLGSFDVHGRQPLTRAHHRYCLIDKHMAAALALFISCYCPCFDLSAFDDAIEWCSSLEQLSAE